MELAALTMRVHTRAMAPNTYGRVLGRNIAAARTRLDLGQVALAERMRVLGFTQWVPQTVSKSERADRRVLAEEVIALAAALGTTVQHLMSPLPQDGPVELPSGVSLEVGQVRSLVFGQGPNDEEFRGSSVRGARDLRGIRWNGNKLEPEG